MLLRMWSNRVEGKLVPSLWNIIWQHLLKLNMYTLYDLAILLLGIYPIEMHVYVHQTPFQ